jgi:hypothetical protein
MGADGAATLGTIFGQGTVLQPVKKLQNISNKLILGVSGSVGVGQRIAGVIGQMWDAHAFPNDMQSFEAMQAIRERLGPLLALEIKYAAEAAKMVGQQAAQAASLTTTVLAIPIGVRAHLYSFGCTGEPEESTADLPFVTIGSGQNLADPFLAFLRTVFWKNNRVPNTGDGVFATFWALKHAIRRNTGGVADPIQMMKLQRDHGDFNVKELEPGELEEAEEAVKAAEEHLSQFDFTKQATAPPPPTAPPVAG